MSWVSCQPVIREVPATEGIVGVPLPGAVGVDLEFEFAVEAGILGVADIGAEGDEFESAGIDDGDDGLFDVLEIGDIVKGEFHLGGVGDAAVVFNLFLGEDGLTGGA
jgi:hypothetical protein